VDGGSTDGTREIVRSFFDDPRLILINQPSNQGLISGALNIGLARMTGDFWTWTQADSYYKPQAIQLMVEYLQQHSFVGMVYTDYHFINEFGEILDTIIVGPASDLLDHECVGVCFLYRRCVYETVGLYSVKHWLVQDYEYRLRVLRHFNIEPYHVPLYCYRVHAESLTGRYGPDVERAAVRMKQDMGYLNSRQACKALAGIDIWQGFISYKKGDLATARKFLVRGLVKDISNVKNVGIISIIVESVVGPGRMVRLRQISHWLRSCKHNQHR